MTLNVLGNELEPCGLDPVTGYRRDGCCQTGPDDPNSHTVCAVVTEEFLSHQTRVGNDLMTPRPDLSFPGLRPGDRWCVIAFRWFEAYNDGQACPVVLAATNVAALEHGPLEALLEHALDRPLGDDSGGHPSASNAHE